ncbi:MAG TPA: DegV family protein [Dehalococcoidales bacterium]|nr:DegV family protein [Dehalococcoidales bacterium]
MTVRIVTDSMADVPEELCKKLKITVVPVNVLFGTETYKDGVDLTSEQFYAKLVASKALPTTAVPSLAVFTAVYEKLAQEADEILFLAISHKLSATYNTAAKAAEMMKTKARIEVIDTLHVIMGEGILAIRAAEAAQKGAKLVEIVQQVKKDIPRIEERMCFDTLEYLKKGGRIGAGQAFLGSILKINPVLGLKDGEVFPVSRERSRTKAIDALFKFAADFKNVEAIAVEYATTPDEANKLAERLQAKFPGKPIYRSRVGAVMGAHVGPSVIAVTVLGDR